VPYPQAFTGAREAAGASARSLCVRFLVPPEVRLAPEPTPRRLRAAGRELDRASSLGPGEWTAPERLTIVSLLAVTVSVIAYFLVPPFSNIYAPITPMVILSTTLVAYAFWRQGRRVNGLRAALTYCLGGGALAGVSAIWFFVIVMTLITSGEMLEFVDLRVAGALTLLAAGVGVAFGVTYLIPVLTRLSARGLRPSESIDRCLTGFGFWGTLVLATVCTLWSPYAKQHSGPEHPMVVVAFATLGAHALMFLVGLTRSLRRHWWLARVVQGNVPGWQACERSRFAPGELDGLELFSEPWFRRERAGGQRVLAQGIATRASDVYRECSPVPKFLIGE